MEIAMAKANGHSLAAAGRELLGGSTNSNINKVVVVVRKLYWEMHWTTFVFWPCAAVGS